MKDQVQGLQELDAALGMLPRAVARREMQQDGIGALKVFVDRVKELAPVDDDPASTPGRPPGTLRDSYHASTRLNKSQARQVRREGKQFAEVYAGTGDVAGVQTEFGNAHQAAEPHARPAWEQTKMDVLSRVGSRMWERLQKARGQFARIAPNSK